MGKIRLLSHLVYSCSLPNINNNLLEEFSFDKCLQTEFESISVNQSLEMRGGKKHELSAEKIIAEYSFFLI